MIIEHVESKDIAELFSQLFIPHNLRTYSAQQCLIQSDVEQLLGALSVHSSLFVYLISSKLLLKATDLDWIQQHQFTVESANSS